MLRDITGCGVVRRIGTVATRVGERVASGIYFYQLETDDTSLLRKMVILK